MRLWVPTTSFSAARAGVFVIRLIGVEKAISRVPGTPLRPCLASRTHFSTAMCHCAASHAVHFSLHRDPPADRPRPQCRMEPSNIMLNEPHTRATASGVACGAPAASSRVACTC